MVSSDSLGVSGTSSCFRLRNRAQVSSAGVGDRQSQTLLSLVRGEKTGAENAAANERVKAAIGCGRMTGKTGEKSGDSACGITDSEPVGRRPAATARALR